jgi:predicted PurR-regulated permease PerM
MALPIRDQAKYWGIAAAVFFLLMWLLSDVILPFIVGAGLAYFLDPVADRLEKMGMSRVAATALITVFAILMVVLLVLSIIPSLISQLTALVNAAPQIAGRLQAFLLERFPEHVDHASDAGADCGVNSGTRCRTGQRHPVIRAWYPECGDFYRRGAGCGVLLAA